MKPTLEQRLEIYKLVLVLILADSEHKGKDAFYGGLCSYIANAVGTLWKGSGCSPYGNGMKDFYPEIYAQKPKKPWGKYWWYLGRYGMNKRIEIVEKAIENCNLLLEKSV